MTAQRAQRTQRAQRLAGGEFPRIHRDELLRGHSWSAVLTGSQVYGTPSESSDVDLVILASPEVQLELSRLLGAELNPGSGPVRFGASSLRVGKLNLIMTCDPAELAAWRKGTAELATRKPVTREQAVAHLKACGVGLPDVEGEVEPEGEAHPWL